MNKRYLSFFLLLGCIVCFGCKQTMPTQNNPTPDFQVDPSGDIILTAITNTRANQIVKITNKSNDTLKLGAKIYGGIYFPHFVYSIAVPPQGVDSVNTWVTYIPLSPGYDTAMLSVKSSAGDSITRRLIGHATGDKVSYLSMQLAYKIGMHFKKHFLYVGSPQDSDYDGILTDSIIFSGTQIGEMISAIGINDYSGSNMGPFYSYRRELAQLVALKMDTNNNLSTAIAFSGIQYRYSQWNLGTWEDTNQTDTFFVSSAKYTADKNFLDIFLEGDVLFQSLQNYNYVYKRDGNLRPQSEHYVLTGLILSPQKQDSYIHITITKK